MPDQPASEQIERRPVWLSGAILTLLNKIVFPIAWLSCLVGIPLWVFATVGRISIAGGFEFIVWFVLIATAPLMWLTVHLQRVGYCGRELVVANYWREARIPFEHVAAVEPVWWYKERLVRIRFSRKTAFGSMVYYMPKWGPARALHSSPEDELRRIIGHGSR